MDITLRKKYYYPRNLTVSLSVPTSSAERALSIFRANGGVLKTQWAMKLGIHPRTLYALRDDQFLKRLERGLYRLQMESSLETQTS
jgi:hypothetical protein